MTSRNKWLGPGTALVMILAVACLGFFISCTRQHAKSQAPRTAAAKQTPHNTFPTSLHATRAGKANFYSATYGGKGNAGFEALTNVPMSALACRRCHPGDGFRADDVTPVSKPFVANCGDCHVDPDQPAAHEVTDDICLGCHSRQSVEAKVLGLSDVHRDASLGCTDCHSSREMHGDGTAYDSMVAPGAMDTHCTNCHDDVASANAAHTQHVQTAQLDCAACHVQTVPSCYNCHLESSIMGGGKRFVKPLFKDFVFLVNRDRKGDGNTQVTTATFQSLCYKGRTFYTIAPFFSHTVTAAGRDCDDCHGSRAVTEYDENGTIVVARWDAKSRTLKGPSGVVPIPPDWRTALLFDFLTYTGDPASKKTDPAAWKFLKTGADATQMLFATPLTEDQMDCISE
ncbi:MAG: hypothetical protein KAY37_16515 [Phycisphaerae bacterium]|nr:hypothetical protein [Phycisphaerae bacterium]